MIAERTGVQCSQSFQHLTSARANGYALAGTDCIGGVIIPRVHRSVLVQAPSGITCFFGERTDHDGSSLFVVRPGPSLSGCPGLTLRTACSKWAWRWLSLLYTFSIIFVF